MNKKLINILFIMAGMWINTDLNLVRTPVPDTMKPVWAISALLLLAIAAFVLLPTLNFT